MLISVLRFSVAFPWLTGTLPPGTLRLLRLQSKLCGVMPSAA